MECELCAMEGIAGEASDRCTECGEWLCAKHTVRNAKHDPLCPGCFDAVADELNPAGLVQTIEEPE